MTGLAITASGMVTAVGFNAAATCAALRAGVRNVNETSLKDPETGAFLPVGKVALPHWWIGIGKLADLVAPSILECFEAARPVPPPEIPVLIGVAPPDRPFRTANLEEELIAEIEHRFGFRLHSASGVIAHDRVSGAIGLRAAGQLVTKEHIPCVIMAAVDSLIQPDLVSHFMSRQRILTPKISNGFCVGEAGSAVLVQPATNKRDALHVLGIGTALETATVESEEPLRAEGLAAAIREALGEAGRTIQEMQYRIADLNGEHYKFKEMTLAMMRFERRPKPKLFDLWHPIEYIGDVGAAICPLVLGFALHAGAHGYAVGPTALCTFSNDNGERAAIVTTYRGGRTS